MDNFQEQFDKAIQDYAQQSQYGVYPTTGHTHNGTDSLLVDISSIARFPKNPSDGDTIVFDSDSNQWLAGTATGTVTSVSVVSAHGFAGTVATSTTTPAITLSTTITGLLQGNGTSISAVTIGSGLTFSGGTLSSSGDSSLTVNADETISTNYSSTIIGPGGTGVGLNGWNTFTGFNASANAVIFSANTTSQVGYCGLNAPDPSNNFDAFSCETTQTVRLKTYGTTFAKQTADYGAFGFGDTGSGANFADRTNHSGKDVKFIWNSASTGMPAAQHIWCVTSDGAGVTATAVATPPAIDQNTMNMFEIVLIPFTSAKFYINGALVATNTTNLYASTSSQLFFEVGGVSSGGTGDIRIKLSTPVFTITL